METFDRIEMLESMVILVDSREQPTDKAKKRYESFGFPYKRSTLSYGDYTYNAKLPNGEWLFDDSKSVKGLCILERKMNLDELASCLTHSRDRFEREFKRAKENNARILLLVENASWAYKLTGLKVVRSGMWASPESETRLVEDSTAGPLWARYYDLKYCEPYVCDRDGLPRRRLEDIGHERRNGYAWFGDRPAELYPLYEKWADENDPMHKVAISLTTKGANENGLIQMFRQPKKHMGDFDVVVCPGESIQSAIEKAPEQGEKPFKIFICKGTYRQKVIIDRPNIVLVGEQRDSTIITLAETEQTKQVKEYRGQPVHHGVVILQEGADDCVISGLTVYNSYGTTVEPGNTIHQMAVYGRATRTIIINSNIWADGNDALSLWAPEGGMYYHADLQLRCLGVDFLCPRGWCYATRCQLIGDGHALIWHDGRGDKDQKLVITNSRFDALRPTELGRYHHDSQFYIINCQMTNQILDKNIEHAYKGRTAEEMAQQGKTIDPCPWGPRIYYYGCRRDGGHSGWLKDNLKEAPGSPEFHEITARWTFKDRWDPEQRIRDLWDVVAY